MNKFFELIIWPDKLFNRMAKFIVISVFSLVWLLFLINNIFILGYVTLGDFIPLYSILVISCFLTNRNLPIGGVTYDFEENKNTVQVFRFFIVLGSLFLYVYYIFL